MNKSTSRSQSTSRAGLRPAFMILCACLLVLGTSGLHAVHAQSVTILHSFYDGSVPNDGGDPLAALVRGEDGNLYGTTYRGGTGGTTETVGGTVYRITPSGTETILHNFYGDGVINDGSTPMTALVLGRDGNFYGTTESGGSTTIWGTAFRITPAGKVTILHSFDDGSVQNDGHFPSTLIQARNGEFYGTTHAGGAAGYGTVFKMTPSGKVTILHSFLDGSVASDGVFPQDTLVEGRSGDFFGTTASGGKTAEVASGALGSGTVFRMTPAGRVTILHNFSDGSVAGDGSDPVAALARGDDGWFYGTTQTGGGTSYSGDGTVFKIGPSGRYVVLHRFDGSVETDGIAPYGALIQGRDGDFYGTTSGGGSTFAADPYGEGDGTAFKMTRSGVVTILHSFGDGSVPNDGIHPYTALVAGPRGEFYGTTVDGGSAGVGTVFRLSPARAPLSVRTGVSPPVLFGVSLPVRTGVSPGTGAAGSPATLILPHHGDRVLSWAVWAAPCGAAHLLSNDQVRKRVDR